MNYIEREAAKKAHCQICFENSICYRNPETCKDLKAFDAIPAADVRPVVHGEWRYKTLTVPGGKGQTYAKWSCTNCKGKFKERSNFCPDCGADMREEEV